MEQTTIQTELLVEGMHCAACELFLEKQLSKATGVQKVEAKLAQSKVAITSNAPVVLEELNRLVADGGYNIVHQTNLKSSINWHELGLALLITLAIVGLFMILQSLGITDLIGDGEVTLPLVFLIGIVASLSTCMAVVGGLVLSLSSGYAKQGRTKSLWAFHLSRLISFFVLGGVIGMIGSAFVLTPGTTFGLNIILFAVMLIMGINLLDIFPWARRWQLKMPKVISKKVFELEGKTGFATSILLGAATFILPCGFTQSMQVYSLTGGTFLNGALTMFVFALGTLPALAMISFVSVKFSQTLQSGLFFKTAGLIIIFFAGFNFLLALVAVGIIPPFI
jgi:sulfite exporter TauE/SafE/copper chaperone CopZ